MKFAHAYLPEIRTLGLMQFDPIWAQRMHETSIFEILHIHKGKVKLIFENISFDAGEGDILLVPPKTLHRDSFDIDKGVEILFCSFSWVLSKQYLNIVNIEKVNSTKLKCRNQLGSIFSNIIMDLHGGTEFDMLLTRSRILTILLTILRETVVSQSPATDKKDISHIRRMKIFKQAMDYLNMNYAKCVSLDEIADSINISPYYLSHIFSEESGLTLFSYLTNLRMNKAGEFLKSGKLTISEIAYKVGYENANYFSKVFRKHFNCSPTDFAVQK
ncbi:MAG TPA: AraC family transcriptional regulator [Phycisphaerae bacterium]|nr:AraC family transcriptional regulator [Phycisphaerae bacterium]